MRVEVMTVTPEMADGFLEMNTANRKINRRNVDYLKHCLESGQWRFNGEAIKFNGTKMADGQHRCIACVETGIPFESLVVFGLEDDAFATLDTGKKRNAIDVLGLHGYKNTAALAAAVRLVIAYQQSLVSENSFNSVKTRVILSNQDYLDFLESHPTITESATYINSLTNISSLLAKSIAISTHYLFSQKSKHEADIFFRRLADGSDMNSSDPILLLRNKLFNARLGNYKPSQSYIFGVVVTAWNAYRRGIELNRLYYAEKGTKASKKLVII